MVSMQAVSLTQANTMDITQHTSNSNNTGNNNNNNGNTSNPDLPKKPRHWTPTEDYALRSAIAMFGERKWKVIASYVPGRSHTQCLQRWSKVLTPGLKKGQWSPEEDEILLKLVLQQTQMNSIADFLTNQPRIRWGIICKSIIGRTAKQCRERWTNHLNPQIKKGHWTPEEDAQVLYWYNLNPRKWAFISKKIPGRTENAVKIRWKSLQDSKRREKRRAEFDASFNLKRKKPTLAISKSLGVSTDVGSPSFAMGGSQAQQVFQQEAMPSMEDKNSAQVLKLFGKRPDATSPVGGENLAHLSNGTLTGVGLANLAATAATQPQTKQENDAGQQQQQFNMSTTQQLLYQKGLLEQLLMQQQQQTAASLQHILQHPSTANNPEAIASMLGFPAAATASGQQQQLFRGSPTNQQGVPAFPTPQQSPINSLHAAASIKMQSPSHITSPTSQAGPPVHQSPAISPINTTANNTTTTTSNSKSTSPTNDSDLNATSPLNASRSADEDSAASVLMNLQGVS